MHLYLQLHSCAFSIVLAEEPIQSSLYSCFACGECRIYDTACWFETFNTFQEQFNVFWVSHGHVQKCIIGVGSKTIGLQL